MNERVRELIKLANRQYSQKYYPKEFLENFAKLIIQECVQVLVNRNAPNVYGEHIGVEEIKQHFGVK